MKRILLLLPFAMLTGCASPRPVPVSPYQSAKYECERDMADSNMGGLAALALYHDCMRAHGWSK
jgi:hypothetical protein